MNNAMINTLPRLILSIIFLVVGAGAQAGLQEGIRAYNKGNNTAALKELKPLAENGDPKAQVLLGMIYDRGKGVPQDHKEAASWFRKAADQGNTEAQIFLAVMHERGIGVQQDGAEAVLWYRKAAEGGASEAQYILGGLYEKGRGVPIDRVQAHKWFNLAVETGFEIARQDMEEVEALMSREQVEEARSMAREWLAKHK